MPTVLRSHANAHADELVVSVHCIVQFLRRTVAWIEAVAVADVEEMLMPMLSKVRETCMERIAHYCNGCRGELYNDIQRYLGACRSMTDSGEDGSPQAAQLEETQIIDAQED